MNEQRKTFLTGYAQDNDHTFTETSLDVTESMRSGVWLVTPRVEDDCTFLLVHSCPTVDEAACRAARHFKVSNMDLPRSWQVFPLRPGEVVVRVQDMDGDTLDACDAFAHEWIDVRL